MPRMTNDVPNTPDDPSADNVTGEDILPDGVRPNGDDGAAANQPAATPTSLRSVYTSSLAEILQQTGISLAVSTYQAGKVILVRYDSETGTVNTHFRNFTKPMGITGDNSRLTIGARIRSGTIAICRLWPASWTHRTSTTPRFAAPYSCHRRH
ncbi:MAG: DUF4915 domain-containing protein [Chloroflexota bacterium]